MRFRITVRGDGIELRGYLQDYKNGRDLSEFAESMGPWGVVVASPAEDDYDPFKEREPRELHHFETEEENARLKADHTDSEKNLIDVANKQADVIERALAALSMDARSSIQVVAAREILTGGDKEDGMFGR